MLSYQHGHKQRKKLNFWSVASLLLMIQTWLYQFSSSSLNTLNFISAEYILLKMCGLFTIIIICPLFYISEHKQKGGRKLPNARNYFPAKPWSSSCIVNYFTRQKRSTKRQQDAQQDTICISQHVKSPSTTCPKEKAARPNSLTA